MRIFAHTYYANDLGEQMAIKSSTQMYLDNRVVSPEVKEGEICIFPATAIHRGMRVESTNRKTKKTVYYFPKTSNQKMLKLIKKIKFVSVILLHRCCSVLEDKSWIEIAKDLNIKYLYTDNWFILTQNNETMRVKELISKNNLRLISKNSYFQKSNSSISKNTTLNSQQLFDSFIYLFQLQ